MNKKGFFNGIMVLILILGAGVLFLYKTNNISFLENSLGVDFGPGDVNIISNHTGLTVANWNLQIFGVSKASDKELMNIYISKIKNYDIIFIQEIRDVSGNSFDELCSMLPNYNCKITSRAGRSNSKEQVGLIYKKGLEFIKLTDFNPDAQDRWERPPGRFEFNYKGETIVIYNIHIKPDAVNQELEDLEVLVNVYEDISKSNVILIGDYNADCSYYNPIVERDFIGWDWVISDDEDTTVAESSCAYDRIIISENLKDNLFQYGVDKDVTAEVSDHYLVWAEFGSFDG